MKPEVRNRIITRGEMQDILVGLRSLDSVNGTNRYGQLMEKLSVDSSDFLVVKLVCVGMQGFRWRPVLLRPEWNGKFLKYKEDYLKEQGYQNDINGKLLSGIRSRRHNRRKMYDTKEVHRYVD